MLKINSLFIAFILITFFVFAITFTAFYTKENFSSMCGCKLPIWVIVISIASFGLFTGSVVYYLLAKSVADEKKDIQKSIPKLLNFLSGDERRVMEFLIEAGGESVQSRISKNVGIDKVKTSRVLKSLEERGILSREKRGMSNIVVLDESLKEVFLSGFKK